MKTSTDQLMTRLLEAYGIALHRCGAPVNVIEERLNHVLSLSASTGAALVSPSALWLQAGDVARVVRLPSASVDLATLAELEAWERELKTPDAASLRALEMLLQDRQPLSSPLEALGFGMASATTAVMLGGRLVDPLVAVIMGELVRQLWRRLGRGGFAPLALFIVSAMASALASLSTVFGASEAAVAFASLIIFVPGLGLTTALIETAAGHQTSGNIRLMAVVGELAQLAGGLLLGAAMVGDVPQWIGAAPLPVWAHPVALLMAPVSFAILLRNRIGDTPAVVLVSLLGYAIAAKIPGALGAGIAAGIIGLCANGLHRLAHIPRLSIAVPGIILLVPGMVGVRGVRLLLEHDLAAAGALLVNALACAGALAMGLLVAFAAASPTVEPRPARELLFRRPARSSSRSS